MTPETWNWNIDDISELPEDLDGLDPNQLLFVQGDLDLDLTPETRKQSESIQLPPSFSDQDCLESPGLAQEATSPGSQELPSSSPIGSTQFNFPTSAYPGLYQPSQGLYQPSPGPYQSSPGIGQPSPGIGQPSPGIGQPSPGYLPVKTMKLEAPSTPCLQHASTPSTYIKNRLITKIKGRRPELKPEYKNCQEDVLSAADLAKRENRRQRNKLAAKKCREKKKAKESVTIKVYEEMEKENKLLKLQLKDQRREQERLEKLFKDHLSVCKLKI